MPATITVSPQTYGQQWDSRRRPQTSRTAATLRHRQESQQHDHRPLTAATMSAAEFAELPFSIQRKHFSPVERLRIADRAGSLHIRDRCSLDRHVHPTHRTASIPSLNGIARAKCRKTLTDTNKRLRRHRPAATSISVDSFVETQWFLNLPAKVKQTHFSRGEQERILARCHSLADDLVADQLDSDSSDEDSDITYRARRYMPPAPSLCNTSVEQLTVSSRPITASSAGSFQSEHSPQPVMQATSVRYFKPQEMVTCFESPTADSKRFTKSQTMPSTFEQHMTGKKPRSPKSPSSRRNLSLSGFSHRHSTSSMPSPLLPSPFSRQDSYSSHKRTLSSVLRLTETPGPVIDPNAVHYRDPEARLKLRTYLGSPQKFDEAIEYGFPSAHESCTSSGTEEQQRESTDFLAPLALSSDLQSFMNDDWLSFLDENDEAPALLEVDEEDEDDQTGESDANSLPDTDSPVTPADVVDMSRHVRLLPSPSSPSREASPTTAHAPTLKFLSKPDLLTEALSGNREMTLRMTLTRPDLRGDDFSSTFSSSTGDDRPAYTWRPSFAGSGTAKSSMADPLALDPLALSDDTTGMSGPFAVNPHGSRTPRHGTGTLAWKKLLGGFGKRDRR